MNLLELFCDVDVTKELTEDMRYDFWSVTSDNDIILMRVKDSIPWVPKYRMSKYEVASRLFNNEYNLDCDCLVSSDVVKKYMDIDIKFEGEVTADSAQKYPLMCVRGACGGHCNGDCKLYCFHRKPCFNNRPDWNCWSAKYPEFMNFLFDIVEWIQVCDVTDAIAVMFQYTPTVYDSELSFTYSTAIHISGKKITVVKDTRKWYETYNKKYPTSDREIEKSINYEYFSGSTERFKF